MTDPVSRGDAVSRGEVNEVATLDLDLVQLLCTRLTHDLAGPIGALSAGIELLDGDDPSLLAETVALLRHSAEAGAARLKFLRAAFGAVSAPAAGPGPDVEALVRGYVRAADPAIGLEWRQAGGLVIAAASAPVVLALCLTALDCLGGRGVLAVDVVPAEPATGSVSVTVAASGPKASLVAAAREALTGNDGTGLKTALSARSVHHYLLARMAERFGGVAVREDAGHIGFHISVWTR